MRKLSFDQFGVMSVGYQQYSLEYTLDSIAESGLKYVDFWGGAPHYCAFDTPPGKRQEKVLAIRKMLDDRGLKMSVFTAEQICLYPINVASDNEYVRKNSIRIVKEYIEDTKAFEWLQENAQDYGFVLRYPKDKQDITGITYESWHWRYVGEEHAKIMKEKGFCLEEYIEYLKQLEEEDYNEIVL